MPWEQIHPTETRVAIDAIAARAGVPRTVGRAIRRLANLGIITIQRGSVYEITPPEDLGG